MPGQEFILVEGIFSGCSDALVCIITRIDRRKGKRDRREDQGEAREGPPPLPRRDSGSTVATTATNASDANEPIRQTPISPSKIQRPTTVKSASLRQGTSESRDADEEQEVIPPQPPRVLARDYGKEAAEDSRQKTPDRTAEQFERMHVSFQRSPMPKETLGRDGSEDAVVPGPDKSQESRPR